MTWTVPHRRTMSSRSDVPPNRDITSTLKRFPKSLHTCAFCSASSRVGTSTTAVCWSGGGRRVSHQQAMQPETICHQDHPSRLSPIKTDKKTLHRVILYIDILQQRNSESCCLSGPIFGSGQHIVPSQDQWNGLLLNGRRLLIACKDTEWDALQSMFPAPRQECKEEHVQSHNTAHWQRKKETSRARAGLS